MKKNKDLRIDDWFQKLSRTNKKLRVIEKGRGFIPKKYYVKQKERKTNMLVNKLYNPLVSGLSENLNCEAESHYNGVDISMFVHYMFSQLNKMKQRPITQGQIKNKKILWEVCYLFLKFYKQKPFFKDFKLLLSYVSTNLLGKEADLRVYFLDNDHNISRYIASNLGRVLVKGVKFRDFINPVQKDLDMRMDINLIKAANFEDLDKLNMYDSYLFLKVYIYKYILSIYKEELQTLKIGFIKKLLFVNKVMKNNWIDLNFLAKLNWFKLLYYFFFQRMLAVTMSTNFFMESLKVIPMKLNIKLFYNKSKQKTEEYQKYAFFFNKLKHLNYWTQGSLLKGYKMHFKGRFSRKLRKSSVWFTNGSVGTSYMTANIDFGTYSFILKNSICNLKVWLHKNNMQTYYNFKI